MSDSQTNLGMEYILSCFVYDGDKKRALSVLGTVSHIHCLKVAVNVSRGEQTFPQIMADFSLFVH